MRFRAIIIVFLIFASCDKLNLPEVEENSADIVAIVNTSKLFRKDIEQILPQNISSSDSAIFVTNYINDWAINQILLEKSQNNISQQELDNIRELVNDYQSSLLINNYKKKLILQRLDTIILEDEIETFYEASKENFKLNEELVKVKYLHFEDNIISKNDFIKLFKSQDIEDTEDLARRQLSFKSFDFNDSIWQPVDNIMLKLPFTKEELLKKTKFTSKQDSIDLYLVTINDVLLRNEIAPLSYVKPKIKQIILHKRKIELIKKIEQILLNDAVKNNNFKKY
ncbi:MAG: hypothetical protein CMB99_07600 [Flavobacteriaceae bacterium]|nr:hypothetical protein [Flavobacteriaceae bacterium]|tara:strand:- start:80141 stop:80986 length:846 start_codon:yes stop_codon:yes gene_type:complete